MYGLRHRAEDNHHFTTPCCSHPKETGTWKLTNEKCPISVLPQLDGTAAQVGFLGWQQQAQSQGRWNMSGSDYTGSRAAEASVVKPALALLSSYWWCGWTRLCEWVCLVLRHAKISYETQSLWKTLLFIRKGFGHNGMHSMHNLYLMG